MGVQYRYSLGPHLTGDEEQFEPAGPQFSWYLGGQAHTFGGTIDADSPAESILQELVDDVWVWREQDGQRTMPFRGPVVGAPDTFGADTHTVQLGCQSYRYRLSNLNTNLVASDPSTGVYNLGSGSGPTLAWGLIAYHIASPNDLNGLLTNGFSGSGANLTNAGVATGTDIATAIDSLAAAGPFDWDLIPQADGTIQFQAWPGGRGSTLTDGEIVYVRQNGRRSGGSNATGTRTPDPSGYANKVYVVGQDVNGNQLIGYAGTDPGPGGSYTRVFSSSDLKGATSGTTSFDTTALLNQLAATKLAQLQTFTPSYSFTMEEGWWGGPDHVWLGDAVPVFVRSGRLNINEALRVVQIDAAPADGKENVTIHVGALPPGKTGSAALARTFTNIARRLQNSEWRK